MVDALPDSARRVAAAAEAAGLVVEVVTMARSTRTAEDAARACGCAVAQIVKSLVFIGGDSGRPYLLLVSGENRVDEGRTARALGERRLDRPDADAVRRLTGFAIGGVPPLALARDMTSLIDERLLEFGTVWAAAGTPRCVFAVDPEALRRAVGAETMRFAP